MRFLLTGPNGQFGKSLRRFALDFLTPDQDELICLSREDLDLSDEKACKKVVENINPDLIINAGAYTSVDKAESEPEVAYSINSSAPRIFSEALLNTGGKLLHLSTDYVFNGTLFRPYLPTDVKSPIGVYGSSKAEGEDNILNLLSKTSQVLVLRTSWLMGPFGDNFALKMLNLIEDKSEIKVVSNQIGSPTSSISLARACSELINLIKKGETLPSVLHWSDAGEASWYEVALEISKIGKELGILESSGVIIPIKDIDFPSQAPRPSYSILDSSLSQNILRMNPIHWKDSLKEIFEIYKVLRIK